MAGDKRKRGEKQVDTKRTKEETAVAKHLRFTVPTFKGKLSGIEVTCFKGEDAVNVLLDSKWTKGADALFTTRESCVSYCQTLLKKQTFHLAERERKKPKKKKEEVEVEQNKKRKSKKKEAEAEASPDSGEEKKKSKTENSENKDDKENSESKEKKKDAKKKRKVRLYMPDRQYFEDGDSVFVWIYDPTPLKNYVIGGLMVFGSIGVCLFPLWPPEVRLGIYYLSLVCAGLLGLLLSLVVVRTILFALVWLLTLGKHHFWFLPNLTEDVGVLESFQPLYTHTYKGSSDSKKSKKTKEKPQSDERQGDSAEKDVVVDGAVETEEREDVSGGESAATDAEDSPENGFEIVDRDDVET